MKPRQNKVTGLLSAQKAKSPKRSARAQAVDLLSRREHSRQELWQKLTARGYDSEEIAQAIEWVQTQNFQSDERFSASLYRRRAAVRGDRAIEFELEHHQIRSPDCSGRVEEFQAEVEPEPERAFNWLIKHYQRKWQQLLLTDPCDLNVTEDEKIKLKSKAFQALSARGFQFHNIEWAWNRFMHVQKGEA